MNIQKVPHVVIIGAGFGGLEAAQKLAGAPVRVMIIDRHNYHLFQLLLYGQRDETAGGVAAAFDFAAVGIENPYLEVGRLAWLEQDRLIAAHACPAVGYGSGERRGDLQRLLSRVEDHEIIAEATHLVEVAAHGPRLRERSCQCLGNRRHATRRQ